MKNTMNILAFALTLLLTGCYADLDTPQPAKLYTDADFANSQIIPIKTLKTMYASLPVGGKVEITEDYVIRGKVISSDEQGNIYKSVYLLDNNSADAVAAIELKLNSGYYIKYPVGTMVYVKLKGLILGDYRCMMSIGTVSANADYANANIENPLMIDEHIKIGEWKPMTSADTLVINATNYKTALTDDALGRLVRFEGVTSTTGTSKWGYKNTFPNYFKDANTNFDWSASSGFEPTWARVTTTYNEFGTPTKTYYYGSIWFTYDATSTNIAGQYVVRSSAYSKFRDHLAPANGKIVNMTAIYTRYATSRTDNSRAAYQLLLNTDKDVIVK